MEGFDEELFTEVPIDVFTSDNLHKTYNRNVSFFNFENKRMFTHSGFIN